MALKALLDSIDGLPADVAKEYKARDDGKFVLDVEAVGGLTLEDVTGLKNTVVTLRKERDGLASRTKMFDGLDPDKAKDALERVKQWGDMSPEDKAAELLKAKEAQLAAKFKTEAEKIAGERDAAAKQLDHHIRVSALTSEIAKKKGNAELLLPHVLSQTKMRRTDAGQYIVEVVDGEGNARISPVGSSTDPMTIPQLIDEMTSKFPSAFDASGASGSGATGGGSGAGAPKGGTKTPRTVSRSDQEGMNRSLEDIAKGTVVVTN